MCRLRRRRSRTSDRDPALVTTARSTPSSTMCVIAIMPSRIVSKGIVMR